MPIIDPTQLQRPIVTGTPAVQTPVSTQKRQTAESAVPFISVLKQQLEAASSTAFSKHAVSRVAQRQIDVSRQNLERLDNGVRLAREKGLRDALILIDRDAYIVNTVAGRVVTVDGQAQEGSVFTNIDGTVIV